MYYYSGLQNNSYIIDIHDGDDSIKKSKLKKTIIISMIVVALITIITSFYIFLKYNNGKKVHENNDTNKNGNLLGFITEDSYFNPDIKGHSVGPDIKGYNVGPNSLIHHNWLHDDSLSARKIKWSAGPDLMQYEPKINDITFKILNQNTDINLYEEILQYIKSKNNILETFGRNYTVQSEYRPEFPTNSGQ